ncbi:oligosaccharide flippase family protein [Bifidobacterium sp. SMB2]|uniref:Oligosaccharide flippase family protein n=1 Tax=Bifidobacterium saimiriisciurei TaxID=2661627 RepID=A0ABX0C9V4_9BIFI|nr:MULTISPECIES: oligosaccharide flippase family protein [Bifidobacterium]NEG95340.1 oligosaccharide flippase family protein [Bifidobacterium sp. SMB2]NEH11476.1 oligosaccharide flippase family protein [Bifidobacterium saimiriisciurei]
MSKYKNLILNTGLFGLNMVATKLIAFLLVPVYTYYLSTSEFGVTDMAVTVVGLITPVVTLSIADAVVRFIIDDMDRADRYITIGFWMTLIGCLVMTAILPVLDLSIFGGLGQYKPLYAMYFAFSCFFALFSNIARGLNLIIQMTWASILSSLVSAAATWLFIARWSMGATGFFYALCIGNGVGLVFLIGVGRMHRNIHLPRASKDISLLRTMLAYSLPMIPNTIFWWIGNSVNRFFITGMIGIGASGMFAAASKIPNLLNMVSSVFMQAWNLSAFQEFRKKDVSGFFSNVFTLFRAGGALVASLIMLIAYPIAVLLLQKDFLDAWTLIPVLVVAFFFNILAGFYGSVFTSSMKTKQLLVTTALAAATIMIASWLLIPYFGLYGAAIAMMLSNAVMFVSRAVSSRTIIPIQVNWPVFIIEIIVLMVQMLVVMGEVPLYMVWSGVCFALMVMMVAVDMRHVARRMLSMLRGRALRNMQ